MKIVSFTAYFVSAFALSSLLTTGHGADSDPVKLSLDFKQLPTVPEDKLPKMSNQVSGFRGKIEWKGLRGHTWVSFPFVENPASIGFDRKGHLYVSEANRFWLGVPDLRGANQMIRDDFKAVSVDDRLKMYEKYETGFPEGWFGKVADRIIRLEDRDQNGAADHRTLFSDYFKRPVDGIGFSVLADEDDTVYFTCIPNLWKLTDQDGDGKADSHEAIAEGFGVRVSFIGHDLHGVTRGPDGMLYFSVGDRSYHLEDAEGNLLNGEGRGAIFRCESDGSGLELYCDGLRNPQELAFDQFGNLFTFDNTGDIGDKARMVYALNGTNSGWNMAHQSPHHYVNALDWGDFHPEKSMWVAERMFDTYNEEQPQWVYPPASHVAEGPSGVTYLSGLSIPANLRDRFLLTNYRGEPANSTTLAISYQGKGAGFEATAVQTVVSGIGATDAELGYDGKIYLCDFGGGWSVNTNGSIQVLESTDQEQREEGAAVAKLFTEGFKDRKNNELKDLLSHPDKRVRQAAQFQLAESEGGAEILTEVAKSSKNLLARIHAIWGIGQINRSSGHLKTPLIQLRNDPEEEVRANVIRVLGDNRVEEARDPILEDWQKEKSVRVRSLAAIALGRIGKKGDHAIIKSLFSEAAQNGAGQPDIVLRHAILTGLEQVGTVGTAVLRAEAESLEERLLAVLFLRRKESPELAQFLDDSSDLIRREVIRAIYDTGALESDAGLLVAALTDLASFPETIQRRVMAANYRLGSAAHSKRLVAMAGDESLADSVQRAALQGLLRWENTVETDPVLGHYRPIENANRSMVTLGQEIAEPLRNLIDQSKSGEIIALAVQLADACGVGLNEETLLSQTKNESLPSTVRVAALNSLVKNESRFAPDQINELLDAADQEVQAAAMTHAYATRPDEDLGDRAIEAIGNGAIPVARAAIYGMAESAPERWGAIWELARDALRPELQLDGFLALQKTKPEVAAGFAAESPFRVQEFCETGGDPKRGEQIYLNQGACRQCHKIGKEGGVQGPDLTTVASRLTRKQILTSIYLPQAEIAPGYGTTVATLKDGRTVLGRLAKDEKEQITIVSPDGKTHLVKRADIKELTPPISAMPPLGATLPPEDLRDLVAFIAAQTGKKGKGDDSSHGDSDEAIAK